MCQAKALTFCPRILSDLKGASSQTHGLHSVMGEGLVQYVVYFKQGLMIELINEK